MVLPGPAHFAVCKPFTINYTVHRQILNEKSGLAAGTYYGYFNQTTVSQSAKRNMHTFCAKHIQPYTFIPL